MNIDPEIENNDEVENGSKKKIDYDPTQVHLDKEQLKSIPISLWQFFKKTISIENEVNVKIATKTIKNGIEFYGSNVWILISAIIVASIGLNNNSIPVIIGAMLISPLMGPIRGAGLAIGTNDFQMLVKSLINFGIMVGASLLASYLYFMISPLKGETSELLGRTKPHVLDVLIAFFGGLAGIIAATTNSKSAAMTVVPGVAIATALMPPLCTAGYGLAAGNWSYFFGASYLFLLNSVFIFLSTVIVIRLLKFPRVSFVKESTERKVKIYLSIFLLIIVVPSIFKFTTIINESLFDRNVQNYIGKLEQLHEGREIKIDPVYSFNEGKPYIKLWVEGDYIQKNEEEMWKKLLPDFGLENTSFSLNQAKDNYFDTTKFENNLLNKLYGNQLENMSSIIDERDFYRNELVKLKSSELNLIALERRVKLQYPSIASFTFAKGFESTFTSKIDTVYNFNVHFDTTYNDSLLPNLKEVKQFIELEIELATKKEEVNVIVSKF